MTREDLIKEFDLLPVNVRRRIAKIIADARKQNGTAKTKKSESKTPLKKKLRPLREEPFCGMWADREDMKDPVEWVRNIRRTQWDRSHKWKQ